MRALAAVRHEKQVTEEICPLLTFIDIQECVDLVNEQCLEDNKGKFWNIHTRILNTDTH